MSAQAVRENTRDGTTALIGAFMVIISAVFKIQDADVVAACTTILTVMCHRGVKSI